MPHNSHFQPLWEKFIEMASDRFANSETGIGAYVAPLLLPVAQNQLSWNKTPNTLPLEQSLNAIADVEFRSVITGIVPWLTWVERGVFSDSNEINRAYIELVGPEGVLPSDQFRFGLYWQQAGTFYPKHRHNANELYHVVSGTALWQMGEQSFQPRSPGSSFEHLDRIDHATQTQDDDLLALWAWRRDLSFDNYSMDS